MVFSTSPSWLSLVRTKGFSAQYSYSHGQRGQCAHPGVRNVLLDSLISALSGLMRQRTLYTTFRCNVLYITLWPVTPNDIISIAFIAMLRSKYFLQSPFIVAVLWIKLLSSHMLCKHPTPSYSPTSDFIFQDEENGLN